ncbi:B-cell receptor CD22-like [Pseudorasbora parva]|uniref:B-cell receptor CD22-like n=1 Tax=Pseudorasbora parva TaxID=51549 RepID=UPI00351DBCEA
MISSPNRSTFILIHEPYSEARMLCLFSLVSLLVIPGIYGQEWKVQYSSIKKCVLKGSTTVLSGTYKHPDNLTLTEIFWTVNPVKGEAINLLDRPDYRGRVQYIQKDQTSLLKLSNVRREDEGMYCLRIVTNEEKQRFVRFPGIELKVAELRVEIPEEVVEKQSPVLVCKNTCNFSLKATFLWYKNGKSLSERNGGNELLLESVSSDDTGNYSCATRGQERDQKHLSSPAVTLSVRYPPKSVSVSVSPSVIVEGDSVTLSCSSDSNPPAVNFSWFKENQTSAVGSGQSFSISSFSSSFSGRFYCEAQNKYGSQRSASVSLSVYHLNRPEAIKNLITVPVGITAAVVMTVILMLVVGLLIRRKRATSPEDRNHRGSRVATVESPEDAYITLDLKSRCAEYDTLDKMKRSCDTDDPEDQDPVYYNTSN